MIKAGIRKSEGGNIVLFGLSHGNLDRLREQGLEGRIEIGAYQKIGVSY